MHGLKVRQAYSPRVSEAIPWVLSYTWRLHPKRAKALETNDTSYLYVSLFPFLVRLCARCYFVALHSCCDRV